MDHRVQFRSLESNVWLKEGRRAVEITPIAYAAIYQGRDAVRALETQLPKILECCKSASCRDGFQNLQPQIRQRKPANTATAVAY